MLILGMKKGETVYIGDDVTITLLGMECGQASIGFDAPRSIAVDREKVRRRKEQEMEKDGNHADV